jgi:hypothetical protein
LLYRVEHCMRQNLSLRAQAVRSASTDRQKAH